MNAFIHSTEPSSAARLTSRPRVGVTLMEVIFAIGVILAGLVGIAALIPIAVDNANATMELDRSISESISASAKAEAADLSDLGQLVMFDKPIQGSVPVAGTTCQPSGRIVTVRDKIDAMLVNLPCLDSPGYGHGGGTALAAGLCIDPLGMSNVALDGTYTANPSAIEPFVAPDPSDSAYDVSRFPYFSERYNVLSPPNQAVNTPATFGAGLTKPWPMGPRMYRLSVKSPLYDSIDDGVPALPDYLYQASLISKRSMNNLFRASGGVAGLDGDHKEDPPSLLSSSTLFGSAAIDNGFTRDSRYSWFITLAPPFLGGNSFRQSIVIVKDRLPPTPRRLGDPLSLQKPSYAASDEDDNPESENLAWVGVAIGFSGGAGGDVRIFGSGFTDDLVQPGQYVMLSRQPHLITAGGLVANGPAVHRWYKVLRVGDSRTIPNLATGETVVPNWPHGTPPPVWSRWLTLSGPDWTFQDESGGSMGGGNTSAIDDTFCTIVPGAVSVIESQIRLDL